MRRPVLLVAGLAAVTLAAPASALALSLDEAIALARKSNPEFAIARAQADGAKARKAEAEAARWPSLTVSGESGQGSLDLGGFFGIGKADVSPRGAQVELRAPLFTGGAVSAAIAAARAEQSAAEQSVSAAAAGLETRVAEAYVGVQAAERLLDLARLGDRQAAEILRQARLRFEKGEIARTDVDQATAHQAEARADLARATGEVARARAHFHAVVGVAPETLEPAQPAAPVAASLDDALAQAERTSPQVRAAADHLRAAEAGVRLAEAERLPSIALAASGSTVEDKFFPGYKADGYTVGVQGRWTLFAGGAINARVAQARSALRAARAASEAARANVREGVVSAWSDLEAARLMLTASRDRATAAAAALDSVGNEVRVGQKATLDLLNAERDRIAADAAVILGEGRVVTAASRLNGLVRGG